MKNLTIILLLLPILLFAQEEESQSVKLKAGANFAKANVKGADFEYAFGFSLGAIKDFRLGKTIFLESGVVVEKYSTLFKNQIGVGPVMINTYDVFVYLTVPVIFQFHTGKTNFNLGPQVGYLVSAFERPKKTSRKNDTKDQAEDLMINWAFGLEVNTGANFDIGGRFLWGYTDINNGKEITDAPFRLNAFQVYLAFPIDNF